MRKRIATPSHSLACTCFFESRCALLYLRTIQTIIIPVTLKESSEVELPSLEDIWTEERILGNSNAKWPHVAIWGESRNF